MAFDHPVQRSLQALCIELAVQAQDARQVVGAAARIHLLQEPQALLGKCQWLRPGQRVGLVSGGVRGEIEG
ncbi:hypothetical protein D3C80_2169910 [compost metagenome]